VESFDDVSTPVVPTVNPFDAVSTPAINVGELSRPHVNAPHGIFNAIWSGIQSSASGLLVRGGIASYTGAPLETALPSQELPQDATTLEHVAAGAAGIIADLPEIVFGAIGGTAITPGVGTVAGGFAVPAATRAYLMQAYKTGGIRSFGDLWEATKAFTGGAAEGVALGLATAVPGIRAAQIASAPLRAAAVPLAEAGGMTAMAAALQERMPTWQEFQVNAILVGGFRSIPAVRAALQDVYAKTGIEPAQVAVEALADPKLRKELMDPARDTIPTKYEVLAAQENAKMAVPEMTPAERAKAVQFVERPFADIPQAPGEKALPTHFNYNYINSPADIAAARARISELYADDINAARRETVTWEAERAAATQRMAKTLGTRVGRVPVDATMTSQEIALELRVRNDMADKSAEALAIKSREILALGDAVTEAQIADALVSINRSAMIAADALGMRAEVARAFNSIKDIQRTNLDFAAVEKIIQAKGGRQGILDALGAIADADSPASVLRVARRVADRTVLQNAYEVWKAGLVSGLGTFETNILGNLQLAGEAPTRAVTAGVGKIFEIVGKAYAKARGKEYIPESKASIHEVAAMVRGWEQGSLDGLKLANAVLRSREKERIARAGIETRRLAAIQVVSDGVAVRDPAFAETVNRLVANPTPEMAASVQAFLNKLRIAQDKMEHGEQAKVGSKMYLAQTPFRVLSATDALFRTWAEQGEAHTLATRDALSEGLELGTEAFRARTRDILLDPTPERAEVIRLAGDRGVYTMKLGPKARYLQMLVKDSPLAVIVPFIQISVNLMKRGAAYTPVLNFLLKADRAAMAEGGVARDEVVARMVIGATIVGVGATAVAAGTMTGGGYHLSDQSRKARKAAGIPDYGIKVNGKWYEYRRLQPAASLLMAVGDYSELSTGNLTGVELTGAVVAAVGSATISQQYLQGLSNAVNTLSDPARYGARFLDQYAASLVPGLIGQTAAEMDPHAREINSIVDAIQARIPVWREELYPVRNPLTGAPAVVQKSWLFSPVKTHTESTDKILMEAARLEVPIASAPRSVHIGADTGKIGKVEIGDKERNEFIRAQGEFAHEILSQFVMDPSWDERSDFEKKLIYSKVLQAARLNASLVALPAEAREWEAIRIATEVGMLLNQ
jgi:hypothetical protein